MKVNNRELARTLSAVANELREVAAKLKDDPPCFEWEWSTYALEAYAAVYEQLKEDTHA